MAATEKRGRNDSQITAKRSRIVHHSRSATYGTGSVGGGGIKALAKQFRADETGEISGGIRPRKSKIVEGGGQRVRFKDMTS